MARARSAWTASRSWSYCMLLPARPPASAGGRFRACESHGSRGAGRAGRAGRLHTLPVVLPVGRPFPALHQLADDGFLGLGDRRPLTAPDADHGSLARIEGVLVRLAPNYQPLQASRTLQSALSTPAMLKTAVTGLSPWAVVRAISWVLPSIELMKGSEVEDPGWNVHA